MYGIQLLKKIGHHLKVLSINISVTSEHKHARHRINKGTGQALYQERRKRYLANPKAKNDVCDALTVVDAKPTK
jgi:hypothetical protein